MNDHLFTYNIIYVGAGLYFYFIYAWKSGKKPSANKLANNNNNLTSHDVTIDNIYPESPNVKSLISQFNGAKENPLSKTRKATIAKPATVAKPVVIINKDGTMRASRSKK